MTVQKLSALEKAVLSKFAERAGLAAMVFEAWSRLPDSSVQTARSLVDAAHLNLTEESATKDLLEKSVELHLAERTQSGVVLSKGMHGLLSRIAFALYAVDHYRTAVHKDLTVSQVVLTRPPRPSVLEERLSELGWRTAELDPTDHAFRGMVRSARQRLIVMTPFFDEHGARWLKELLSSCAAGVERVLILRGLEDRSRRDYPVGYDALVRWLNAERIRVFNYSIPRTAGARETFHAKAILCDRNLAYLGSSNVNAASLEHSMEMGVVLEGRAASVVAEVIDAVMGASQEWT